MLSSFKARLPEVFAISVTDHSDLSFQEFRFTKNRIWFTKNHIDEVYYLSFFEGCPFQNGALYTIEKAYDREDKLRWLIRFTESQHGCRCYAVMNWRNAFICNFMHNRYWLLNEKKWFVTFAVSLVAIAVSILALVKSDGNHQTDGAKNKDKNNADKIVKTIASQNISLN